MDTKAFRTLSCGLYIVGAKAPETERAYGCIINTFLQVTSQPAQASIAINKENATCAEVRKAMHFTVSVLDETAPMELIGTFGFHSSVDTDKFAKAQAQLDRAGVPFVTEHTCARFSVKVTSMLDVGTHMLFIGEVEEADMLSGEPPMTYAYYHQVKGGKTPPKAPSYQPNEPAAPIASDGKTGRVAYRCLLCGHVEYVDELPDGFTCPICGAPKEMFERIEV